MMVAVLPGAKNAVGDNVPSRKASLMPCAVIGSLL
jgi:hypothetical protein